MSDVEIKNFKQADDSREIPGGRIDTVRTTAGVVNMGTLQPGWRWSTHIKPLVGTDLCEVDHFDYVVSGRLGVRTRDGQEYEVGPGEVAHIPPGHEGWVIGDEPCVTIGFAEEDFGRAPS